MRFIPNIKEDIKELEFLISNGEGEQLDFKQSITSQKKIARTLVAFANNGGGKLLIGVKDNGELCGCDTEQEMYMIDEGAKKFCKPPLEVIFSIYEKDNSLSILEVEVLKSFKEPHVAKDEHDKWQLYIRDNDKTIVALNKQHENEEE